MLRSILMSLLLIGTSFACVTTPKRSAWFPFEMKRDKMRVSMTVKGEPATAVIDTGAGITVIDKALAEKLRIYGTRTGWLNSLAASERVEYANAVPFNFLGAEIKLNVMIQDLSEQNTQVYFGTDLLRAAVVEFDFPLKKMRFHNLGGYKYAGPTKPIKLIRKDSRYQVQVNINGEDKNLLVDTGAFGSITIPVSKSHLEAKIKDGARSHTLSGMNNERTDAYMEVVKPFPFGSYTISNANVRYYDQKNGDASFDGILGMSVLKEFNVIIDTEHSAMYLEAYEPDIATGKDGKNSPSAGK